MLENSNQQMVRLEEEEMTLKDLIGKISDYAAEIKRSWKLVVLIGVPFLVWQGYVYYNTPVKYPASLTFMVNEEEGGGLSSISGLLGSFGLGAPGENNYERILYLAKSERILREALLTKVVIEGQNDYLANHFIKIHKVQEKKWSKSTNGEAPLLKDFLFTKDSFERFDRKELTALKSLYGLLVGSKDNKSVFSTGLNEDTGIMTLSMDGQSEELSITFLETLFYKLSNFYVEKTIEKNKETFNIIRQKVDSIRALMAGTEYQSALFEDKNKSLLLGVDQVPRQRFTRDKQILMIMYGEAIKNQELADFALKSKTPYIQPIDMPGAPIKGIPPSKKTALLMGLCLGILLGSVVIITRKAIVDSF
jgi:hypothetical protein